MIFVHNCTQDIPLLLKYAEEKIRTPKESRTKNQIMKYFR